MNANCIDCPLQTAFAQYVIEQDIQPGDVSYKQIFSNLTLMDGKRLERLTEKDSLDAIDTTDCPGPRKTFCGLGKKACRAGITLKRDDRQII